MDEENPKQQSTSLLELLYLIRVKNKGELSFSDWRESALRWAQAVIAEYERRQADASIVDEDERYG